MSMVAAAAEVVASRVTAARDSMVAAVAAMTVVRR
jgi:hypothetical protein